MRLRPALAACVVLLLAACGGGGDDDGGSDHRAECERAWEDGLGNAQRPGIDRDEWVAECVEELEASDP